MTTHHHDTMQRSQRRPGSGAATEPPQEVVDRLAGLLPEDVLQDALAGLAAGGDHRARAGC